MYSRVFDLAFEIQRAHAEQLENSKALVAAYKQAIDVLAQYGAMPMAGVLELEVKKEQRRQRIAANEAPAVAAALADLEAAKAADERRHRLAIQDVNRRAKENAELQKAADEAKALLKKRKKGTPVARRCPGKQARPQALHTRVTRTRQAPRWQGC